MSCRTVAVFILAGAVTFAQGFRAIAKGQFYDGPGQPDIGSAYQAMGKGDYAQADRLMDQALGAALKSGPYVPAFATTVQQVADYYANSGLELKGESIYKNAIDMARRDQAGDAVTQLSGALANYYTSHGREVKGLALFVQVIADIEARNGTDAPELGPILTQAAWAAERVGNLSEAEALLKRAASIKPRQPKTVGGASALYVGTGAICGFISPQPFGLANFYLQHRRYAEAEQIYTAAIEAAKSPQEQIMALQLYAGMLRQRKRYAEAEATQMRIIDLRENSSTPGERQAAQWDRQNLAHLYMESGNYEGANKLIDEQVQRAQSSTNRGDVFQAMTMKTEALIHQGKMAEATSVVDQMLDSGDPNQPYQKQWAFYKKAEIADKAGDHKAAEQLREAATKSVQNQSSPDNMNATWEMFNKAQQAANAGRIDESLALVEQALSTAESASNPMAVCNNVYAVTNIAHMLINEKKQPAADRLVQRGLADAQQSCSRQNGMNFYDPVVSYYVARGFTEQAKRIADTWEENTIATKGQDSPMIEWILRKRAEIARAEQDEPQAAAFDGELLKRSEANHGPDSQEATSQRMQLARLASMRNDFARAEDLWRKTLPSIERLWGGTQMHASALGEIADFYTQAKRFDEAKQYAQRALDIAREADDSQPQFFQDKLANIERLAAEKTDSTRVGKWFNADRFNR
jgi:tetratricopeptide (TPR) repeat protein